MTKAASNARDRSDEVVLSAAARLFREQGFAATSVRDVAKAAGMLPGSLHYRYASKDDILVALMERAIDRLVASVLAASSAGETPLERVRLAMIAHLEMLLSREDSIYVLLYDYRSLAPAAEQAIARQRARYEAFADELIARAAAEAPIKPGVDLYLVRQFAFGAANWVAQWFDATWRAVGDDASARQKLLDQLRRLAEHEASAEHHVVDAGAEEVHEEAEPEEPEHDRRHAGEVVDREVHHLREARAGLRVLDEVDRGQHAHRDDGERHQHDQRERAEDGGEDAAAAHAVRRRAGEELQRHVGRAVPHDLAEDDREHRDDDRGRDHAERDEGDADRVRARPVVHARPPSRRCLRRCT